MKGYERYSWEGFSILFEGTSERSHAKAKHRILSFGSVGIGMAPFFGPPSFFWPSSGSCLLLLVNQSPHFTTESETKFTEGFSLAIIALEAACLLLTAIVCIVAVISSYCGGSGTGVLNLGSANVTKISQALRHTATELLKIEAFYLQKRLCEMNNYDLERIKDVITLMSMDVFPDTTEQYRFHRRISLNVASRHSGFATPEMQSIPFSFNDQELVPHDLDQSEQSQRDEIEEDQQVKQMHEWVLDRGPTLSEMM